MNKREYCESRESIAYYNGLNGLEIKGIEYGIDNYIYCVSGAGMVQCSPGWCTGYNDYKGTCRAINAAIKVMRDEVNNTPTWAQYERVNA